VVQPGRALARRILNASLLVAVFFGLDKVVSLVRQVLVARAFGLSPALDAYNAANKLPDLLFALISGGALALAFIPVLTATLGEQGRASMWRLFARVANLAFVVTAAGAALMALAALPLTQYVVAPGFNPGQQALVASLLRLNLAATLVFSISGLVMGALQAQQHFLLPALAPLLYSLGQIGGLLVLVPRFGIYGLAYGVILGALLHLAVQAPGLWRYHFQWWPELSLADPTVRRVLRLMGPRVVTLGLINLVFIATNNLASHLGAGAVSALAYGWAILQLPETVIGTALGTALLPTLAEYAGRADPAEFRRLVRRSALILVALAVPATVAAIGLVQPAVRLVFEGRAFTADDTALVVLAARLYLLGLTGQCLIEVGSRAFYARQDARTPMLLSLVTLVLFIVLGAALNAAWGMGGLALANSAAFSTEAVLMLVILRRRRWL
jgi:putative peptidoglycan lipid II flippase